MDMQNVQKQEKKSLTNSDKSDRIWHKMKDKAASMGYCTMTWTVTVQDGEIVEVCLSDVKERIRA